MKGQIRETFQFLPSYILESAYEIPPDNVTDAAKNDQQDRDKINNGIMDIIAQAVVLQDIHARVAECGHCVK